MRLVDAMVKRSSLKFAGLHHRTLRAYKAALDRFLSYLNRRKLRVNRPHRLDAELAEFIDRAYQEGDPMSYSGHLLSAIKRFHPSLRMELPISSQYFRNWQRCYRPTRAVPADWALVEAMMARACEWGYPQLALLLGLGFNALLRTSEMMSLTHRHLLPHALSKGMSVIIPTSKTSQGNPQVVLVLDRQLISFAKSLLRDSEELLWPCGPYRFRQVFGQLLQSLGFQQGDYSPYSLRRGGCTWYFQSSLSLDLTVARGRWSCGRTAKQYIDEGTAQLAQVHWTRRQRSLIKAARTSFANLRLRQDGKKWKRRRR